MTYVGLEYLKKNSPPATLTVAVESTDTTFTVDHLEYFHNSTGGLITKSIIIDPGNVTKTKPEEITITAASTTSGPGDITGITRAVHADGSIGQASSWDSGTEIAVHYTYGRDKQIADNFAAHQTLITARATKTTATTSVYVDAAATGTGDGTSYTNAFTTIQAAIDSLPTVLEHAVTIYVRKGASAYSDAVNIQQIIGKGSLTIRGEFYWTGQCAAAGTPAADKFRVTAADASNIDTGDYVLVTNGYGADDNYTHFLWTTVSSSSLVSGTTYELTLAASADWGNIGTSDYFSVVKTANSGAITITNTNGISLIGFQSSGTITATNHSVITAMDSVLVDATGNAVSAQKASAITLTRNCLFKGTTAGLAEYDHSYASVGSNIAYTCVAVATAAYGNAVGLSGYCKALLRNVILHAPGSNGYGLLVSLHSYGQLYPGLIAYGTTYGEYCNFGGIIENAGTCWNKATTPKTPASSTDPSYIV